MKIKTNKTLPTREELLPMLQQEFGDKYEFYLFGWGAGKSIMVKKTSAVGARIMLKPSKNQIVVVGDFPSKILQGLFGGLILIAFVYSSWKKIENEMAAYFEKLYV